VTSALLLATIAITADFEGGSTGPVKQVNAAHFRIGVKGERDQAGRNRQATWYYFRVDGAQPGQPVAIDMVDLPGEYNFRPNNGAITGATPPVISYDAKNWAHVHSVEYDKAEPKLRLNITPERSRFWVAHTPPYTNTDLEQLRRDALAGGAREQIIGKSVGGRDLLLWTIGKGSTTIWLMF
jgi:hypothetical protein